MRDFTKPIPDMQYNGSDLVVGFPNEAEIELVSGGEPDNLRGAYYDGIVIDEPAQMHPELWQVVRPALADRNGTAIFIGTPMGRFNRFYELYKYAGGDDNDWTRSLLTCEDTNVLPSNELMALRREMDDSEFAQELLCSFDAAIKGAYYASAMDKAQADGRIRDVPYDEALPVIASIDLGMRDATVVIYWQVLGSEIRALECDAYKGTALSAIIKDMRAKDFPVETVIAPHDAKVRELGTGRSRMEVAADLGVYFELAPKMSVADGINATRELLSRVYWDKHKCEMLIEAMRLYRAEEDARLGVLKAVPLHDWTSDYADAVRYFAVHHASQGGSMGQVSLELFLQEAERVAI